MDSVYQLKLKIQIIEASSSDEKYIQFMYYKDFCMSLQQLLSKLEP